MADDKDDDADNSKDADDNDIVGCGDEYFDYNNNYGDGSTLHYKNVPQH